MFDDYYSWNIQKIDINRGDKNLFFHEREIWFASLGINIGFEQNGKGSNFLRPVLVIKMFNNKVLWCVPLTRRCKEGMYYFHFKLNGKTSVAILSQIKFIDSKRLQYKIGDIEKTDFTLIKEKLKLLLE